MSPMPHELRRLQLRGLRQTDPARLIATYRQVANLNEISTLPPGVTFASMIAAIIANETGMGNQAATIDSLSS